MFSIEKFWPVSDGDNQWIGVGTMTLPPRAVVDPAKRTVGLMAAFAVLVVPVKLIKNFDISYIHPINLCVVK